MLTNLIDEALSWPNKIDIYFYAPGAGGEFFTTLCSLSHLPTREILYSQNIEAVKFETGAIVFKSAVYFNYEEIFVSELGKHLCFYSKYITDPLERINYYRMVLAHSFLNIPSEDVHNLNNKKNILKNKNIILCTHWIKIHSTDKKNGPNFDNRTFGIPLFEKQKYWNIINLDPETEKARNHIINFCKKSKLAVSTKKIETYLNHSAFKNIKLKFPFMDYMVTGNFNAVKDYLENRYGPDLDFDFIDKALINYKKIRIDPYYENS